MLRIKSGFSGERSLVLPKMVTDMMVDDPIVSILYVTDIGYYPKAYNHYRRRQTPIDQYVFIYCIDGCGSFRTRGKRYQVFPYQYFILPAGIPHEYEADSEKPWTIYWIHFKGILAGHYAAGALSPVTITPAPHSRINNRINMFEELFAVLNSGYEMENIRYAMSLFHHYLGSLRYDTKCHEMVVKVDEKSIIKAAIHYMTENVERHISLGDLARYTGYSASRLSILFKNETGHSPLSYINLLKVQHACLLLDNTQMRINQICHKLGINDPYYFSRLFSKIIGISPRAYRARTKA